MSFVVSMIDGKSAYLAADRLMSSKSGLATYRDTTKILPCAPHCAVGVAGEYIPAERIVRQCINNGIFESFNEAIQELKKMSLAMDFNMRIQMSHRPDCTFMLAGQWQGTPRLALLTLSAGKVQIFQEPLQHQGRCYFFANPDDVPFEWCQNACCSAIELSRKLPVKTCLENLVCAVAKRSAVVNTHVDLWCSQPLSES